MHSDLHHQENLNSIEDLEFGNNHEKNKEKSPNYELIEMHFLMAKELKIFLSKIDTATYNSPQSVLHGATIGMHVRHIIDCYNCLLSGLQSGELCYENRERNPLFEIFLDPAKKEIDSMMSKINELNILEPRILNYVYFTNDKLSKKSITTTLDRELLHCLEHAIHHMAILKVFMTATFPEVILNKEFGVAPSTLRFQKNA